MMVRLLAVVALYSLALPGTSASAQVPVPSASPKITTATCGKPVCTWNAFGPVTYTRDTGKPQTVSSSFSVLNPNTQFTLHVDNNGVSSAVISLNGIQVFGPDDFRLGVTGLDRQMSLAATNTLQVELRSAPGTSLAVTVIGVDNDPPTVLEGQSPLPNAFDWNNTNVSVSFACSDATSGIASCTKPVLLTTEGLNQIVSGTGFDLAGNSQTASFQVSIDETPPTIVAAQSPLPNSFGWQHTPVTINFSCNDSLSGVQSCTSPVLVSSEGQNQSVSGTAIDFAGNIAGASAALNIDVTPPVVSIGSPANGLTVTSSQLQISGAVSDNLSGVALVTCNGAAAIVSSDTFSCSLSLISGANTIQVQATDKAGNTANSQITITFNATPVPPPKSLLITPSLANMLIGDTRPVALIGDIGQPVSGAIWGISDATIVSITTTDPPQLTALAQGTATLTAGFNGLTATMTINVLPGTAVAAGTPLWTFDPLPGNTITEMVPGNPVNPGDPDLYSVEVPDTLRGFTKDGLQLWAVSPGTSPSPTASFSALSAIQAQPTVTNGSALSLTAIPTGVQDLLRKHGAFQTSDLLLQQQRLIEQYHRRGPPISTASPSLPATSSFSPLSLTNTSSPVLTTLLVKSVSDNNGGTINLIETLAGCCQVVQASLLKIDNSSQQQVWRQDFSSPIDENFAIGDDDTIYSSQLILPSISNRFDPFGSAIGSLIFAIDGTTGLQKFSVPLPAGHFKLTDTERSNVIVLADVDVAAQPGPLSILPDGSINAVVSTVHLEEDFQGIFSGGFSETAVSDHKTLQLLTVQADGSFTTQPIQAFDFDQTGCQFRCNDPGAGYLPNEVVPDGQGGLLATWTGTDNQLGITNGSAALVRHFDNAGNTSDYFIPFAGSSWFRRGNNNPHGLVVGDNDAAVGSDGQSIIAFDVNTGAQLWSFTPPGFQGTSLLATTPEGGVAAVQLDDFDGSFDDTPNALLSFDATGAASTNPFAGGSSDLSYFDSTTLLAIAEAGQGALLNASAASDPNERWEPQGDRRKHRIPKPQITITQDRPLWWFGNQQPIGFTDGATEVVLTANGKTNGTFKWVITEGSSKATFSNNQASVTSTDSNTITLISKAPSNAANDVKIQLTYRSATGQVLRASSSLSVDAPFKLITPAGLSTQTVGASHCRQPAPDANGYFTQIPYQLISKFGRTVKNIAVNESFDNFIDLQPNNWPAPAPGSLTTPDGTFADGICVATRVGALLPRPLPPQNPLTNNAVDQFFQTWFVGSTTPGSGSEVQSNTQIRFIDHGAHTNIVSPIQQ